MFGQILSNSTVRNIWRTVKRIYMFILGLKVLTGSQSSIFCPGPNPGSWRLSTNTAVCKRAKMLSLWCLPFAWGMRKFWLENEIVRATLFGELQKTWAVILGHGIFLLFLICVPDLDLHCRGSISYKVKIYSLCLCRRFPPGSGLGKG